MDSYKRAGVLPYTVSNTGEVVFCFLVDAMSGNKTDGGGQPCPNDANCYETACRELSEETFGCLKTTPETLKLCAYMQHDQVYIFLLPITLATLTQFVLEYSKSLPFHMRCTTPETCGIKLLFYEDVLRFSDANLANASQIYSVVAEVIRNNLIMLNNLQQVCRHLTFSRKTQADAT